MYAIAIVGAGKIGGSLARLLVGSGDYAVTLIDQSQEQLDRHAGQHGIAGRCVNIADAAKLDEALRGHAAVLSAAPYQYTAKVAKSAARLGLHYLDSPRMSPPRAS